MTRAAVCSWAPRAALALLLLEGAACQKRVASAPPKAIAGTPKASVASVPVARSDQTSDQKSDATEPPPRPLHRCFPQRPAWVDAPVADLLDRAADLFDAGDFENALGCAEEAARQAPRSVEAHHNRAAALLRLDRVDEARDAFGLALALAPDDPETLEAAADLYINQLAPTADRSLLGLEYARRAERHARPKDHERRARLALLEGQALIDLGRSTEALHRLDASLALDSTAQAARYERGVALFELCRFEDARHAFEKIVAGDPSHAHALYHLGLIEERLGAEAAAERHLAAASTEDPKAFPPPPAVTQADFTARVRHAVDALDPDMRRDLAGVSVEAADLPASDDLTAEKPPLSPTILGLYRGLPLDWNAGEPPPTQAGRAGKRAKAPVGGEQAPSPARCEPESLDRTIVLYRRNILRTVRDSKELDDAIARTLLHEVGHLRGEDDGSLRDRGLE
ncbi:MAG TPA: tetratricopeptide repeat protein [Polyangia bacterium]|nr:tetratricopeptide repeat protein [Polyangia bacterium]